ncbi:XRE family transcriptional regulator [Mesorhizobium huakuii]|uniref:XRE family transcriptional regulator n=1 Tax=Mesorhizobium huakuii TaxID=28104 RepID=UPI003D7ABBC0
MTPLNFHFVYVNQWITQQLHEGQPSLLIHTQADIASALNIKQPSVSKIEKQADMYLSTLRNYVEAIGGQLELTVKLPARPALRLQSLGDVATTADASSTPIVARRHTRQPPRSPFVRPCAPALAVMYAGE